MFDEERYCEECAAKLLENEDGYCAACNHMFEMEHSDCDDYPIDGVGFANPGSALRAETPDNPRDCDCPTCGAENVLTRIDRERGYQCDTCAENGGW